MDSSGCSAAVSEASAVLLERSAALMECSTALLGYATQASESSAAMSEWFADVY